MIGAVGSATAAITEPNHCSLPETMVKTVAYTAVGTSLGVVAGACTFPTTLAIVALSPIIVPYYLHKKHSNP